MKLQNIEITFDDRNKEYWYSHKTDTGGTEPRPFGFVTLDDLLILKMKIEEAILDSKLKPEERNQSTGFAQIKKALK